MSKAAQWYEDRDDVIAFGKAMTNTNDFSIENVWEYLEKPWKWTDEHDAWVKLGRPHDLREMDDLNPDTWGAPGRALELERRYSSWP